jgi:hypothetical protein
MCKKGCRNRPIVLAHELGDAFKNMKGISLRAGPEDEKLSLQLENKARKYYCVPLRLKY